MNYIHGNCSYVTILIHSKEDIAIPDCPVAPSVSHVKSFQTNCIVKSIYTGREGLLSSCLLRPVGCGCCCCCAVITRALLGLDSLRQLRRVLGDRIGFFNDFFSTPLGNGKRFFAPKIARVVVETNSCTEICIAVQAGVCPVFIKYFRCFLLFLNVFCYFDGKNEVKILHCV